MVHHNFQRLNLEMDYLKVAPLTLKVFEDEPTMAVICCGLAAE